MILESIASLILAGTLLLRENEQIWTLYNIQYYGTLYGVNLDDAYQIARCESKLWNMPSDFKTEDSFGPFQLQSQFWIKNAKRFGFHENPEMRYSIEANVQMALKVASVDGWGAWHNCGTERNLLGKKYNNKLALGN